MAQAKSLPGKTKGYLRRLWRFFGSLKLAVILLIAVTVVSLLGTLFPQLAPEVVGDPQTSVRWLAMAREKYGARAGLYETLGLFDVYHSPWFILLITALILNTLVCTINRLKATWRAISARPRLVMSDAFYERTPCRASLALAQEAGAADAVRQALARRHYRVLAEEQEGAAYLYADRNRWARLGTLITHLSVALIVLGFAWSQGWGWRERAVALGPGELYQVGHGNSFLVRCDGFEVERYPGGLPKDYRARLTILQGGSEVISKIVRVNDPLSYQGVGFYLSSYGPAARVRAHDTMGKTLRLQIIGEEASREEAVLNFAGEGEGWDLLIPSLDLALHVVFYYEGPSLFVQAARSGQAVFADFVYDGEAVELEDARFEFALDRYVVLQVVSDPGFKLAISAAFLAMGGLIVSLYFPHRRIWAKVTGDEIRLAGLTVGDKVGFEREFTAIVGESGG
ncbi:MAG: cytochrome c biogenesis protein ResB [Anaerolineae bacterium]